MILTEGKLETRKHITFNLSLGSIFRGNGLHKPNFMNYTVTRLSILKFATHYSDKRDHKQNGSLVTLYNHYFYT